MFVGSAAVLFLNACGSKCSPHKPKLCYAIVFHEAQCTVWMRKKGKVVGLLGYKLDQFSWVCEGRQPKEESSVNQLSAWYVKLVWVLSYFTLIL